MLRLPPLNVVATRVDESLVPEEVRIEGTYGMVFGFGTQRKKRGAVSSRIREAIVSLLEEAGEQSGVANFSFSIRKLTLEELEYMKKRTDRGFPQAIGTAIARAYPQTLRVVEAYIWSGEKDG